MSVERKKRLAKLVKLENRLKAFHESRHAGHLADASRHAGDAEAIRARFDDPSSLSSLFPDIYHRGIEVATAARAAALALAAAEEKAIAAATIRTARVEERHREASRVVDEKSSARELQELIDRGARPGKPATS